MKDQASRALASRLQGIMNDLKRDIDAAARELALSPAVIEAALQGDKCAADQMRLAAAATWPVSERDLAIVDDDTEAGLVVWRRAKAEASARVITRGGAPYYEYRDTAMSRLSPIRPEWIRMLATTDYPDPTCAAIQWNKGHALHQFTYFRGDVDFYFEENRERRVCSMKEGDSAFIPSFVPHTFAANSSSRGGHIIAVTFQGRLTGDAREELATRSASPIFDSERSAFGARLDALLKASSTPVEQLATDAEITTERLVAFLDDHASPTLDERARLASALEVAPADLVVDDSPPASIVIRRRAELREAPFPSAGRRSYRVKHLAQSQLTPQARAIELEVESEVVAEPLYDLHFGLHQYAYVLQGRVRLQWLWEGVPREVTLSEGDSIYMKPGIPHGFARTETDKCVRVLSFRSANAITLEVEHELRQLGSAAGARYASRQRAWY